MPASEHSGLIEASMEELRHIAAFLREREGSDQPRTVLIGGWAVHSYNPWYGSIDIDLITNHRTRGALNSYLRSERGYVYIREPSELKRVVKNVPSHGQIMIDFASREIPDPFEGVEDELDYSCVDDHCELREMGSAVYVHVPRRSLLLLLKMKAEWDRGYRISSRTSQDPDWEGAKLRKDHADILALMDPAAGGDGIDVNYLGDMLDGHPFLVQVFEDVREDVDAIEWYGRMSVADARERLDRLVLLLR